MKLTTINYRYEERRSKAFQSASVALEATVAIEDGDDRVKVLQAVRQYIRGQVRVEVEAALAEIIRSTPV